MAVAMIILIVVLVLILSFPLVTVCGESMYPTYKDSEIILATKVFSREKIKVGDVCIYRPPSVSHEGVEFVIKRVVDIRKNDGYLFFIGDNELNSYDSRNYGYVSRQNLVAKVIKPRKRGN